MDIRIDTYIRTCGYIRAYRRIHICAHVYVYTCKIHPGRTRVWESEIGAFGALCRVVAVAGIDALST